MTGDADAAWKREVNAHLGAMQILLEAILASHLTISDDAEIEAIRFAILDAARNVSVPDDHAGRVLAIAEEIIERAISKRRP